MDAGRRTQDAGRSVSSPVALMALRGLRRKSPNVNTYSQAGHGPLYVSKDINPEHVEPTLRSGINYEFMIANRPPVCATQYYSSTGALR